jgi:hypothetical protein
VLAGGVLPVILPDFPVVDVDGDGLADNSDESDTDGDGSDDHTEV